MCKKEIEKFRLVWQCVFSDSSVTMARSADTWTGKRKERVERERERADKKDRWRKLPITGGKRDISARDSVPLSHTTREK